MDLNLKTPPAKEILEIAEVKTHLRVDVADEDSFIDSLIKAARIKAEIETGRAFITQTWEYFLDDFPSKSDKPILIPKPPLQTIESIKYIDQNGKQQTWSSAKFQTITKSVFGKVMPIDGESYPSTQNNKLQAVTIEYKAGYGDDETDVPSTIIHAVKLTVGHWYSNRESVIVGKSVNVIPDTVKELLNFDRVYLKF